MKRSITKSIATALALGLPLVGGSAIAQQQTYPGSMCVSASSSPATVTTLGQARNPATNTSIRVICPIVRDLGSFATGNTTGNVWVTDGHLNLNVCCSSRARNPANGSQWAGANQCTNGVVTFFNLPINGPVVPNLFAYRYLSCSLPGILPGTGPGTNTASLIEGYRLGEL